MFSGVPNGLLRLSPPQVHAAVHNSGAMDLENPPIDFVGLARSLGATAEKVTESAQIEPALVRAFANNGPNLIEVVVDGRVE